MHGSAVGLWAFRRLAEGGGGISGKLFMDAYNRGLPTCFIGGEPGRSPWHGCLTGGGDAGLCYLVNGTLDTQRVTATLPGLFQAMVLFQDGPVRNQPHVAPDRLTVDLLPEQMVLLGLGEYPT